MDREALINGLANMQEFVVVPHEFYEEIGEEKEKNRTSKKNKTSKQKYNAATDPRFGELLNYASPTRKGQKTALEYMALTMASNLSLGSLNTPTGKQMDEMLKLAGYTASQMDAYVQEWKTMGTETLPSRRLAPTVFLLTRLLYDTLSDPVEWTKAKRTEENAALVRLRSLTKYMLDNDLLSFCYTQHNTANPAGEEYTFSQSRAEMEEYEEFVIRHAEYALKIKSISSELDKAFKCVKKKTDRIQDDIDKEFAKAMDMKRNAPKQAGPVVKPKTPVLTNQGLSNSLANTLQDGIASMDLSNSIRALQTIRGEVTGADAMSTAEMQELLGRAMKTLPLATQQRIDKLEAERNRLIGAFAELGKKSDELRDELDREHKVRMRQDEYVPIIAEAAFRSILTGTDEIFKIRVGRYVWQDLMMQTTVALPIVAFSKLEDDDMWDGVCPETNGKLGLRIYDEDDLITVKTGFKSGPDTIDMPLSAMLSKYSGRTADSLLYIRKSHIKMFKDAGYSDRKARDFAIVLATLASVNNLETNGYTLDDKALYGVRETEHTDRSEDTDKLELERKAQADTERRLKQAQKENQSARHEIHMLQKEVERLQQKLAEAEGESEPEQDELEEPEQEAINYPYRTNLKVVVYGGFEVFHKELEKLVPGIRIVESSAHVDVTPVRGADIVFLQTNKTNHSNYWAVRDACRNNDIPYVHLNYASAKRCAEVMVREIQKEEARRAVSGNES